MEVHADLLGHEGGLPAHQRVQHLAVGPDRATEGQQLALDLVESVQQRRGRVVDDFAFQVLEEVAHGLDDRVVGVDHRVDERIREIPGAAGADPHVAPMQPFADRRELVAVPFLEREDIVGADEHRQLLVDELGDPVRLPRGPHDHQGVIGEHLDLGTLRGVDDVFQRERVDAEGLRHRLDDRGIAQPANVDPADVRASAVSRQVGHGHLLLPQVVGAVLDEREGRGRRVLVEHQRPRAGSHGGVAFAEHGGALLSWGRTRRKPSGTRKSICLPACRCRGTLSTHRSLHFRR